MRIPEGARLALVKCRGCGCKFVAIVTRREDGDVGLHDRIVPCSRAECRIGNLVREDAEAYVVPATGGHVALIDALDEGFEGVMAGFEDALELLEEVARQWNAGRTGDWRAR